MTGKHAYLYGDSEQRKQAPICEGLLWYAPDACAAIAAHSLRSNRKHNGDAPMHHARGKSSDHPDCILRHVAWGSQITEEGIEERIAAAWRAMVWLQEGLEQLYGLPMAPNAVMIPPAPDYAPDSVAFRTSLKELAREAQSWGMYTNPDTAEKSPLAPTRIATPEELSALAKLKSSAELDITTLRNAGIGDVPCNPRASHDAKIAIDMAWDAWRARTDFGTPAETAYLASFAPNPHPMMAEALRDEYEKTDGGTGL